MAHQQENHILFIRDLLQQRFKAKMIKEVDFVEGYRYNFSYRVELVAPITNTQAASHSGTVAIPEGTTALILRIPNPEVNMNHSIRLEHEVAAISLLRDVFAASPRQVIPNVYGWSNTDGEIAWILEEMMPGITLSKVFPKCSPGQQRSILAQLAEILQLIQHLQLPESIKGFGGFHFDGEDIVSGPLTLSSGGPFAALADMYKATAVEGIKLSDKSNVLDGWRGNNLRERLDAFVEKGLEQVCAGLDLGQKTFVHGDFTLENFLINPETLNITAFLDCETCYTAHAIHEYFHSFYDLYSFLPGPYVTNPQNLAMHKALLHGFPDPLPDYSTRDQTISAEGGSKEDVNWNLSQMWAEELDRAGALRPARMGPDAEEITALYWFAQDICPAYLLLQPAEKAEKVQLMYREKGGEMIKRYLERWGY